MTDLERTALVMVLTELAGHGERWVPFAVSARHVHLSEEAVACLFGRPLTVRNALSQPGQYACHETVEFRGPRGTLKGIRVLGPTRAQTQLELSMSDCRKVGAAPPVRLSGDLNGSPGGVLVGPAGEYTIKSGLILAKRHLHLSREQAKAYGLRDGETISVAVEGPRPGIMADIPVRVGEGHTLDLHIDTDEANGWLLGEGDIARIVSSADSKQGHRFDSPAKNSKPVPAVSHSLITEAEVNEADAAGQTRILCAPGDIITPAARDRAALLQIEIAKEM